MNQPLDLKMLTHAQQRMWATGDYARVAISIVPSSEALVEAVDPHAGQRVLDVACGTGNTALVAARRYCEVTGVDYVPELLERARQRAAVEGVELELWEGDAQALPFRDGAFDVVLSTFGVMFAPDQERAAAELLRVCHSAGKIGLASWTPDGEAAGFFRILSRHAPPPPGAPVPTRWGTEQGLRELFGSGLRTLRCERRRVTEHFRTPEHALAVFRTYFGPTRQAFERLGAEAQRALADDLLTFFRAENRARDGSFALSLEYLLSVAEVS